MGMLWSCGAAMATITRSGHSGLPPQAQVRHHQVLGLLQDHQVVHLPQDTGIAASLHAHGVANVLDPVPVTMLLNGTSCSKLATKYMELWQQAEVLAKIQVALLATSVTSWVSRLVLPEVKH